MMVELLAAYARAVRHTVSIFQRAFPRDLSKISLYLRPPRCSRLPLFHALSALRSFHPTQNRQRRGSEDSRRVTHPEILGFNCAPDISGGEREREGGRH